VREIVSVQRSRATARWRRLPLWRWCVRLLLVIIVVGMAVNWVSTMLTFGLTIAGWTFFVFNLLSGDLGIMDVISAAAEVAATVLVIWMLAVVISGDKRTVLYLRRFHAEGPQALMRRTLESGLGRRYRLVSLYDGLFQPLEVPPVERWINRAVLPLVVVTFVTLSGMFVYMAPLVFFGAPTFLVPVIVGFLLHRRAIRRRARIAIKSPDDMRACAARVQRLKRWWVRPAVLAPQATVVMAPDALWQDTVVELSQRVDALVVDVSSVTVNLEWELERLSAAGFRRCVLVAERDALREWSSGPTDLTAERCLVLLHDQTVLVYAGKQRSDRRRFARSLERLLDQAVADDAHRDGATSLNASATSPPVSATSTYKPT
jgi:hypothetical protein